MTYGYTNYGLLARPGALPAAAHVAAATAGITIPMLVCIGLILLLTPTGSLLSPRWRWWAGLSVAAAVGVAMTFKRIGSAPDRWRAVNAPHLVALVRAGARFENGNLVERPDESGVKLKSRDTLIHTCC